MFPAAAALTDRDRLPSAWALGWLARQMLRRSVRPSPLGPLQYGALPHELA